MTTWFVATAARYVLVEAADENDALAKGYPALYELYADARRRLGRDVPIEIHTVRPATQDEMRLMNWHDAMVARHAASTRRLDHDD